MQISIRLLNTGSIKSLSTSRSCRCRNPLWTLIKTLLPIVIASFLTGGMPYRSDAADIQQEGSHYIQERNFAKALDCFDLALKEHPNDWTIMQTIACCNTELGRYDIAIGGFQKSIELGGLHTSQCVNLASVYQRSGRPKQALNWLKLGFSLNPGMASDPAMQATVDRLQDPENNPAGSPTSSEYSSSLVSFKGWSTESMPIKVCVRQNPQISAFYGNFTEIVRNAFDQWCKASGTAVSYKLVDSAELANVVCDYTDRRELVSSQHELGIDGNTEMLIKTDNSPGHANIVILVKDRPGAQAFRKHSLVLMCCLHEIGHALGMHGHSPNSHDVMFPVATLVEEAKLSERDKNTIKRIYR